MTETAHGRTYSPAPPFVAHYSIMASAGSGKTFQLTNRYLRLLYDGADPGTILASTFTRLAAGEIRDRIMQRLAGAAVDDSARAMLAEHVHPGLDRDALVRLLETLVGNLHRLQIRTLDSFFAAIVQSFALELGLPAGPGEARLVDEDEDQALRLEAIRLMLDESDPQSLVDLLRAISEGDVGRSVADAIDGEVRALYELYRESPAEAWRTIDAPKPLPAAQLEEAIQAIAALESDQKRVTSALADDLVRLRAAVGNTNLNTWLTILDKGLPKAIEKKGGTYYGKPVPQKIIDAYAPIIDHGKRVLRLHIAHRTSSTYELVERFHRQYEAVKQQQRVLTFSDLTSRVVGMPDLDASDELYFRLDSRVDHMLLDEMQDTSILQWRGLEPLVREIVSHAAPASDDPDGPVPRSFFAVGDVKQSIYGWRGACPEVLEYLPELLAGVDGHSPIKVDSLPRSYRSAPPIIDTVNWIFTDLHSNPLLNEWPMATQAWDAAYVEHDTALDTLTGYAEVRTVARADDTAADDDDSAGGAADGPSQETIRLREAVDFVADLHQRAPDQTIGILVRRNKIADRLLYMLGPAGLNLPATGPGGGSLADAPAVGAILDLLTLSDHPDHTVAAFNVMHGPLGPIVGLTPQMSSPQQGRARLRVIAAVRRAVQRDGYASTIRQWVEQMLPHTDARQARRLAQLLDYAVEYEPRATLRADDFVRSVEHARIRTGERSPIEVMTYHQAKGLQFASVVLPDLDQDFVQTQNVRAYYERDGHAGPISRICASVKKDAWPLVPDLQPIFEAHCNRMMREALCLLYVAVTRAERGLYILIDPARANERTIRKQFSGLLRTVFANGAGEPETILYQHGDPDWLATVAPGEGDAATEKARSDDAAPPAEPDITAPIRLRSERDAARTSPNRPTEPAAPSAHVGDDGRFDLRLHDRDARDRGTAIHHLFEQIEWLNDFAGSDNDLARAVHRIVPRRDRAWIDTHIAQFRAMLTQPEVATLLATGDRRADRIDVYCERMIARQVDGQPQLGIIDRLEVTRDEQGRPVAARIIDWKTDQVSPEQAAGAAERYRPQLMAYSRAVARLYGLSADTIEAMVCFVEPGLVVSIDVGGAGAAGGVTGSTGRDN